uniref:Uncharacterized protein n=5 Tax=Candidatus Kentrum sp. LPFa TaxID=2126335 RepID=A0A450XGU0_9GAMM|nr:MAG: hypothetical protein BECKLPF1236A_GA0070988_106641 [Candidatus Kentron sp. LPFa]
MMNKPMPTTVAWKCVDVALSTTYLRYPNRKTGLDYKALPCSNPSVTKVAIQHANLATTLRLLPEKLNHSPTLYVLIGA